MQQLLKWYFPQCSATCSLAMYIAPYFPIASWICECSNPNFSLEASRSRFGITGKLWQGELGEWTWVTKNCLTVYIRTLWRTLARQSGQVARACWHDEHEQRWPHGRKIISHWKKEDKFKLDEKRDWYQIKYNFEKYLSLQADNALGGLESLNRSGGIGVLWCRWCGFPAFVILWRCTCCSLHWTCNHSFQFAHCTSGWLSKHSWGHGHGGA